MRRNFAGIAAGLFTLVAGAVFSIWPDYFKQHLWLLWLPLGVAVTFFMIWLVTSPRVGRIFAGGETHPPLPPMPPVSQNAHAPMSQQANPIQTQNFQPQINFYGGLSSTPSPTPVVAPQRSEPKQKFNFLVGAPRAVWIKETEYGYTVVPNPQFERGYFRPKHAIALEISNAPHSEFRVEYAGSVLAHLRFGDSMPIGPLFWLGHRTREIDLPTGHPEMLLVMCSVSDFNKNWCIPRPRLGSYERVVDDGMVLPHTFDEIVIIELSLRGKIEYSTKMRWTMFENEGFSTRPA